LDFIWEEGKQVDGTTREISGDAYYTDVCEMHDSAPGVNGITRLASGANCGNRVVNRFNDNKVLE